MLSIRDHWGSQFPWHLICRVLLEPCLLFASLFSFSSCSGLFNVGVDEMLLIYRRAEDSEAEFFGRYWLFWEPRVPFGGVMRASGVDGSV